MTVPSKSKNAATAGPDGASRTSSRSFSSVQVPPASVGAVAAGSFVDAQLVVAERLAAWEPREPVAEGEFLAACDGVGRQMLLQGRLHGPESLSRELFTTALRLAANLDLVDPGRDELRLRREEWAAQVRGVVERVAVIDELDAAARRQSVGVQP